MSEDNLTFTAVTDKGEEIQCTVLFTFKSDETGKDYIVYTDDTVDENGATKVYASIYNPDEETKLLPIETEREIEIIANVLDELQDSIEQGEAD